MPLPNISLRLAATGLALLALTACAQQPTDTEFKLVTGDGVFEFGDASNGLKDKEVGEKINIRLPQSLKEARAGYTNEEIIQSYDVRSISLAASTRDRCTVQLTVNWAPGQPAAALAKGGWTDRSFRGEPVDNVNILLKEALGLMVLETGDEASAAAGPTVSADGNTVWVTGPCMQDDDHSSEIVQAGMPVFSKGKNEAGQDIDVLDVMMMSGNSVRPNGQMQVEVAYASSALSLYRLGANGWESLE